MLNRNFTSSDIFDLVKYNLYIWQGGANAFVNLLMITTLVYHPILRQKKEYIIAGGLALADFLSGMGK